MTIEIGHTVRINTQLRKQLSRIYKVGISIKDISEEWKIHPYTMKRPLQSLGYLSAM
jgi:hypothetical protein